MRLGLGIGLNRLRRGAGGSPPPPAFTPADLFTASEAGFWAPVTMSRLWQDTARTTPVTAVGQEVLSWELSTASGVIYATQATPGSGPLYEEQSGVGRLNFAGGKWLVTPSVNFTATDKMTVVLAIEQTSAAALAMALELSANAVGNPGAFYVSAPNAAGTAQRFTVAARGSAGLSASHVSHVSGAFALPDKTVISGKIDIAVDAILARRNGISYIQSSADMGTGNFRSDPFYIGNRAGASFPFPGRIAGIIVRGAETPITPDLVNAELWGRALARAGIAEDVVSIGDSTITEFGGNSRILDLMTTTGNKVDLAGASNTIANQDTVFAAAGVALGVRWAIIQVGLNDLNPAEAASVAISRLQTLVNNVTARLQPYGAKVFISQMIPVRARLIGLYGGTNGPIAYQKWLDMNEAIAGNGATPITGVDGRITAHVALMNDGSGNLLGAYDTGDGIHPNNAGRQVNADAWEDALTAAGLNP